jgi:hypothetical protein
MPFDLRESKKVRAKRKREQIALFNGYSRKDA